jgi:hypothetical protein
VAVAAGAVVAAGVVFALGARERWRPIEPVCWATAADASASLDVEQTANAALIAAIAERRGLPARAVTIALATAMQESKLRNIDYGDRDSVGLFQQRPSQGWGTVAEIMDPSYAAGRFFDALVKVPDYEDLPITEAAQEVQRSAFPLAYAAHEPMARRFASALTGHSPGGLACHLPPSDTAGEVGAVEAALVDAFGDGLGVAQGETDPEEVGVLTAVAASDRAGWAVAAWSVAHANGLAIDAVEAGGLRWERGWGEWREAANPLPAGETVLYLSP